MKKLLEEIRHELASLNGVYCTDLEKISIDTDLKDIIWQEDTTELINKIDKKLE